MNTKTAKVAHGLILLSDVERQTVLAELKRYTEADGYSKKVITEGLEKSAGIDVGPLNSGGCPCCGK